MKMALAGWQAKPAFAGCYKLKAWPAKPATANRQLHGKAVQTPAYQQPAQPA